MDVMIRKGARVTVRWFGNLKPVALAGAQMKLQVTDYTFDGVVRHIRGNQPDIYESTEVRVYVDPDPEYMAKLPMGLVRPPGCTCANAHVEVNADFIVKVIQPARGGTFGW